MKLFQYITLCLVLVLPQMASTQTVNNYTFTGGPEFFTVPTGVNMIFVTASGAAGGCDTLGGAGAEVCDSIPVSPGMMLQLTVGGTAVDTIGGYNGGGAGGNAADPANIACGGGGASDIRVAPYALGDRILVAGGGGGKGGGPGDVGAGGNAECPNGVDGGDGFTTGGFGGSDTLWGAGGAPWGGGNGGMDGALGVGGDGGVDPCFDMAPGGGGGGGYYGGGGGATDCFGTGTAAGGGGGGGSSYYSVNGCCTPGANTGAGSITISFYEPVGINESQTAINIFIDKGLAQIFTSGPFEYSIYSINGSVLQSGAGYDSKAINMQEFDHGIYLIHVVKNDSELSKKIAY